MFSKERARATLRALADSGAMTRMSRSGNPRDLQRIEQLMFAAGWPRIAGGSAGALASVGPPAGGVDVASGLTSVVPGIRKLKKIAVSAAIPTNGGLVRLDLPKSSYVQKMVLRITGTLRIVQPASPQTITAGDPRNFVSSIELQLSGSTSPRKLTGLQHDIIDQLDVPAINPNAQTYTAGPAGAASSTTDTAFALEFSPTLCVSDQNLYGIPYLGGLATVPQLLVTFADPSGTLAVPGGAGTTITLQNGKVELELWRVDLPAPVAPRTVQNIVDGEPVNVEIPGQGLYHEASYILLSRMFDAQDLSAAGTIKKFRLPIGPDYLRIVLLSIKNGALDDETAPLLDRAELNVQQATAIESKTIWQFDNEYRRTYNKTRPKGVYVFSGVDLTGTDSDLYVTRELGNFDLDVYGHASNAPGANSRFQVLSQQLVPLSEPGEYL